MTIAECRLILDWDKWFEATGDEQVMREWCSVKELHPDESLGWARVIELNRLDRLTKSTIPTNTQSGV